MGGHVFSFWNGDGGQRGGCTTPTEPMAQLLVWKATHWPIGFNLVSAGSIHVALLQACIDQLHGVRDFVWLQP